MTLDAAAERRHRGLGDKRRAIIRGALALFARDGYSRASIDAIAAEAQVSTRTIYNHFRDKAELFQEVIRHSATEVADAQITIIDRYLSRVVDLEDDLADFGHALAVPAADYADHFAMVRQIAAEAGHIPGPAIAAWRQAGPSRVNAELALRLRRLDEAGWLRIDDPERAAGHLTLLTAGAVSNVTYHGAIPLPEDEVAAIVIAGVRAFLRGYLPRTEPTAPPARSIRLGS